MKDKTCNNSRFLMFWFCCTSLKANKSEKLPGEEAAAAAATAVVCSSGVVL